MQSTVFIKRYLGRYDTIWPNMPPYEPMWDPYRPMWAHMGPYESSWTGLGKSVNFPSTFRKLSVRHLDKFRTFRVPKWFFDEKCATLRKGCTFFQLFPLFKGPGRAHMGPYGPIWAHMGPYGPIWALMGPPGQVLDFRKLSVRQFGQISHVSGPKMVF